MYIKTISKNHKFNALTMWLFSIVLFIGAYSSDGIGYAIKAGADMAAVSAVVTILIFLPINNFLKSILVPMIPAAGALGMCFIAGGQERFFNIYILTVCMSAVYFNKKSLAIFSSIFATALLSCFILFPTTILGKTASWGEFIPRYGTFLCAVLVLYTVTKWGNELIQESVAEKNKSAESLYKLGQFPN